MKRPSTPGSTEDALQVCTSQPPAHTAGIMSLNVQTMNWSEKDRAGHAQTMAAAHPECSGQVGAPQGGSSSKMGTGPWVAMGPEAGARAPVLSPHDELLQHVVGLESSPQRRGSGISAAIVRDVQDPQEDVCLGCKGAKLWDHR